LARLYDPTEGRILLDGVDLREYDLESVRHAVTIIFQDFVQYDMRLDENIGVGEIGSVQKDLDGEQTASAIIEAAKKSQADSLALSFPLRYKQMLGRRFENGIELSGGEWQKIGLARAYMRPAQIIILDEPTAALDARAEYETFARFADLVSGQTALLISHRFSTVLPVLRDTGPSLTMCRKLSGQRFTAQSIFHCRRECSILAQELDVWGEYLRKRATYIAVWTPLSECCRSSGGAPAMAFLFRQTDGSCRSTIMSLILCF
jgi:ABC-type polar amino acid transport system ATPase subunit